MDYVITPVPFTFENATYILDASLKDGFMVLETSEFILKHDGKQFLELSVCDKSLCGLCSISYLDAANGVTSNTYLFNDPSKPYCNKISDSDSKILDFYILF